MMASVCVFAIMMVAYYAGQLVMNTLVFSIPGLRIAGGLIVAFIGFRMLFPRTKRTNPGSQKQVGGAWKTNRRSTSRLCRWPCRARPAGNDCDDHQLRVNRA